MSESRHEEGVSANPFEMEAERYDRWFERHPAIYAAERAAIGALLPPAGRGLEIGAGTGRFAVPFGIRDGVEPAAAMRRLAKARGLDWLDARAEALPYEDATFDFALMVVTLCFLDDPAAAFSEARRTLRPGGRLIVGIVDRDSALGRQYEARRSSSSFYRGARFFSVRDVIDRFDRAGFVGLRFRQTLFRPPSAPGGVEPVREGYGEGGFVGVSGERT